MSTKKRRAARTPRTGRPPNRPGFKAITVLVPEVVHAAVVERAKGSGVSMSALLREVLGRELGIDVSDDVARKERPTRARLTDEQAAFAYMSPLGVSAVARRLSVSRTIVYAIRNRRTYRDVTEGLVQPERFDYGAGGEATVKPS
jgi:hypothetical protein